MNYLLQGESTIMDIGSAFTYVFDDEDWIKKLGIGGGIALAGIILSPILIGLLLFLLLSGYMIEVLKNVRDGHQRPLPEWDDFGSLFKTGLFVFLIALVYNVPALLFVCASGLLSAVPEFAELDADAANIVLIVSQCLGCIQALLSLAASILLPAGLIRYAQYGTFGSALQFGEIFSFITGNIGDYIIVVLLGLVAGFVAFFGVILCVVGVFFTFFWSMLVRANLYGQLARKAQGTM
jgi:MFS family permease